MLSKRIQTQEYVFYDFVYMKYKQAKLICAVGSQDSNYHWGESDYKGDQKGFLGCWFYLLM